jgi:hypothetical protein
MDLRAGLDYTGKWKLLTLPGFELWHLGWTDLTQQCRISKTSNVGKPPARLTVHKKVAPWDLRAAAEAITCSGGRVGNTRAKGGSGRNMARPAAVTIDTGLLWALIYSCVVQTHDNSKICFRCRKHNRPARRGKSLKKTNKLHGLIPRTNYTERATAACRRNDCQLLRIKGATWSAWRIPTTVLSVF